MCTKNPHVALLVCAAAAMAVGACSGPVDSSRAITRERIESGEIVAAEELRVAEYLNYYEQRFPEPQEGQVGLDLRLGNPLLPAEGGEAWLQIGLQGRSSEPADLAPLNMALVLDTSGSMADEDKMPYMREAVRTFLGSLAANDRVALVVYSDDATVLEESREVGDGRWIEQAVQRLEPTGGTNLHAGLLEGIAVVDEHYDRRRNNLVVLLTDGNANVGVADPQAIAADAKAALRGEIRLATIGLGHDFNDALLSELAVEGNGSYHFIDRPDELDRVFREAAGGLLQKVASNVTVQIQPAQGVAVDSVTGMDGAPPADGVTVSVTDLGSGESQVLLAHLEVASGEGDPRELVTIAVTYRDETTGRDEQIESTALADPARVRGYDPLRDTEVLRNVTVQQSAEALGEIAGLYDNGRYADAWRLARDAEEKLRAVAEVTGEDQMVEDADLMRQYQDTLRQWIPEDEADRMEEAPFPLPARRGRFGTPTPVRLR